MAEKILHSGSVPPKAAEDAVHLGNATVHGMDYLLTWNCRHLANANIQKKLTEVCAPAGYDLPVICTPQELIGDNDVE